MYPLFLGSFSCSPSHRENITSVSLTKFLQKRNYSGYKSKISYKHNLQRFLPRKPVSLSEGCTASHTDPHHPSHRWKRGYLPAFITKSNLWWSLLAAADLGLNSLKAHFPEKSYWILCCTAWSIALQLPKLTTQDDAHQTSLKIWISHADCTEMMRIWRQFLQITTSFTHFECT